MWRKPFGIADCGVHAVGGPCCPSKDPKAPHCPANNLYCQVRGFMTASINDTYCLEIGACGHAGQPICNHTYATACCDPILTLLTALLLMLSLCFSRQ